VRKEEIRMAAIREVLSVSKEVRQREDARVGRKADSRDIYRQALLF